MIWSLADLHGKMISVCSFIIHQSYILWHKQPVQYHPHNSSKSQWKCMDYINPTPSLLSQMKHSKAVQNLAEILKYMQFDQGRIKRPIVLVNKVRDSSAVSYWLLRINTLCPIGPSADCLECKWCGWCFGDWWIKFQLISCSISFPHSDQISPEC